MLWPLDLTCLATPHSLQPSDHHGTNIRTAGLNLKSITHCDLEQTYLAGARSGYNIKHCSGMLLTLQVVTISYRHYNSYWWSF
jgi:hypothetical protein